MKIEFNLTFEDYLEWQGARLHPKKSKAAMIVALAGFLFLGLGYAILRSSPQSNDFFPGGFFIMFGLFISVGAIPVGILSARHKPERARAELSGEFERFFTDRRALEADETGWRFTYGTAVNARLWDDLTIMRDAARTLILADTFVWYSLPKSAFKKEDLEDFKGLCERAISSTGKLCTVSVISTKLGYASAMTVHNWHRRRWTMLGLYGLAFMGLFFIGLVIWDAAPPWIATPAVALLLGVLWSMQNIYYRRDFDDDYAGHSFHYADILKDAICFRTATVFSKAKYRRLLRILETKHSFLLYLTADYFYIVPKLGFSAEHLSQFRELLRSPGQCGTSSG